LAELVTAVITTYRRKREIIERAIKSVIAQTYSPLELIVVDDNRESDKDISLMVQQVVEGLKNDKVDIRLMPTMAGKHGGQAARNTGIQAANGTLIAFLDDDDEWLPEKIRLQAELLEKRKDAAMAYTRGHMINENFDPPFVRDFHQDYYPLEVDYLELLRGDCIGTTTQAMIRKSALEAVGGFDEALPARQDYEMWIRLAKEYPLVGVDEYLFNYYVSKNNKGDQVSNNWDKCITGHTVLYYKYKSDIDADRKAKFNVIFNLAHYYMRKEDKKLLLKYYIQAFFISPVLFWEKGVMKIKILYKKRRHANKNR